MRPIDGAHQPLPSCQPRIPQSAAWFFGAHQISPTCCCTCPDIFFLVIHSFNSFNFSFKLWPRRRPDSSRLHFDYLTLFFLLKKNYSAPVPDLPRPGPAACNNKKIAAAGRKLFFILKRREGGWEAWLTGQSQGWPLPPRSPIFIKQLLLLAAKKNSFKWKNFEFGAVKIGGEWRQTITSWTLCADLNEWN